MAGAAVPTGGLLARWAVAERRPEAPASSQSTSHGRQTRTPGAADRSGSKQNGHPRSSMSPSLAAFHAAATAVGANVRSATSRPRAIPPQLGQELRTPEIPITRDRATSHQGQLGTPPHRQEIAG
jgi:hypothetical protein